MQENAPVREAVAMDFASINHIEGKVNLADLFTKEDKDDAHFMRIRDLILGEGQNLLFHNSVEKGALSSSPTPTGTIPVIILPFSLA